MRNNSMGYSATLRLTCDSCGAEYFRSIADRFRLQKRYYCSIACRVAAYPKKVSLTCVQCGAVFERWPSQATRQHCSMACQRLTDLQARVPITCAGCGVAFTVPPNNGRRARTCSKACASVARSKQIERTCKQCGVVFNKKLGDVLRGYGVYCTPACHYATMGDRTASHGAARRGAITPEYRVWARVIQVCTNPANPKYTDYGGRGIRVSEAWRASFETFLSDVGPRPSALHSLDRVDNDGPYAQGNCRWATRSEQQNNKRSNHLLTYQGATRTLAEWAAIYNLPKSLLGARVRAGWTDEEALTGPLRKDRRRD